MEKQYRIVRDKFAGYEVQMSYRWWPFWHECHGLYARVNTHRSLEKAFEFVKQHSRGLPKPLPHEVWRGTAEDVKNV